MSLRDSRAETSFADERHSVTAKTDWDALFRDATFMREQHPPTQKGPADRKSGVQGDWQTKFMQLLTLLEILCVFFPMYRGGISSDVFFAKLNSFQRITTSLLRCRDIPGNRHIKDLSDIAAILPPKIISEFEKSFSL